jgi:hypothetical protein
MTDRKKPTAGFWITLALVAVLLYVLSIGPVAWINFHTGGSRTGWALDAFGAIYSPIIYLARHSEWARNAWEWYMPFWTGEH